MDREAPRRVIRLSALMGSEVVDGSGRRVGHVHDVRVRRAGDGYEVEGLIVGRRGIFARFGTHRAASAEPLRAGDLVAWADVTAVEDGRVRTR